MPLFGCVGQCLLGYIQLGFFLVTPGAEGSEIALPVLAAIDESYDVVALPFVSGGDWSEAELASARIFFKGSESDSGGNMTIDGLADPLLDGSRHSGYLSMIAASMSLSLQSTAASVLRKDAMRFLPFMMVV